MAAGASGADQVVVEFIEEVGRRGEFGPALLDSGDAVVVARHPVAVDLDVEARVDVYSGGPVPAVGGVAVSMDHVVPDNRVLADFVEDALPEVVLDKVCSMRAPRALMSAQPPAVVVVDMGVADGDLADIPFHAAALKGAAGVQRVVAGQLRLVEGRRIIIQPVQDDPGRGVTADPHLVVVVVMPTEDPHTVGGPQALPTVTHSRHVTHQPPVWRDALVLHYEIPKWDGDLGRSNCYVPISVELGRRKVSLLNKSYPSQRSRDWWDDETFLALMRIRGMECRSRYAEAFQTSKAVLSIETEA
jgi:hypothetical protein